MKKNTPTLEAPITTPEVVTTPEVDNNSFYTFKNVTVVQVVNYDEVHIAAETPDAALMPLPSYFIPMPLTMQATQRLLALTSWTPRNTKL